MTKGTTSGHSGRPRTTEELAAIGKRRLMLYMDVATVDKLDELCQAAGRSRSEAIARYIEQDAYGPAAASGGAGKRAKSR